MFPRLTLRPAWRCIALFAFSSVSHLCAAGAPDTPLALDEAVRLARARSAQLEGLRSSLAASRSAIGPASQLPDPKLLLGIDNLPVDGADAFSTTRDFMTMRKIGLAQDFTREEKLKLRGMRATADAEREGAMLALAETILGRDTAIAWIDVSYAERQLALLGDLERETQLQVASAEATLAGGKATASDPFVAKLALAQFGDRRIEAAKQLAKARAMLSRWIGAEARRPALGAPRFDQIDARHASAIDNIDAHPHLAMYAPITAAAEAEARLAQAATKPDWSLEMSYAQRGPAYSNMVSVNVRIDLPLFESRRQAPLAAAKLALVEQARAQAEEARRAHAAEIEAMRADWDAAMARVRRYETELLPLSRQRSEAAMASYAGGRAELAVLLDARRGEIEMRLAALQAEAERARAWAQLTYLVTDHVGSGGAKP